MIEPHGGTLVNRYIEETSFRKHHPFIELDDRAYCDVHMVASGAYSPLTGFLNEDEYYGVVYNMRLPTGVVWPIPITLSVDKKTADQVKVGQKVSLVRGTKYIGKMTVESIYRPKKDDECDYVYQTEDEAHPGVKQVLDSKEFYLGGPIEIVERIDHQTPAQTRQIFEDKGWDTIVAFQTRNPMHRAHEYLTKCGLEICDGLLIHPLVGLTKSDDIPADVRNECYHVLIDNYYPEGKVVLSDFPAAMRYAGPREAILHALARQNYGCTHFIVGRDHAGVGNYYGTYDAQELFDAFRPGEIGIIPLKFEHAFFSTLLGGMATNKTAPGDKSTKVFLSGTKVREMLSKGEDLPPEFTRPEVSAVLKKHYSG